MSRLDDIKAAYDNIQVPAELKERVLQSMERGKKDACGEKKESGKAFAGKSERNQKKGHLLPFVRVAEAVAAAVAVLVISVNVSPTVANAMEQVPVLGAIVKIVNFTTYSDKQEKKQMEATVRVPEVKVIGTDGKPLTRESKELNAAVSGYLDKNYIQVAESTAASKDVAAVSDGEEGHEEITSDYRIVTDNRRLFSLRVDTVIAMGGSDSFTKIYNIDKKTGKMITLKDLFREGSDYKKRISDSIKEQMRAQMKKDSSKAYFLDDDQPEWDFKQIKDDADFYISDNGELTFVFDKYEVAPGYMGLVEFSVPTEKLSDIVKDGYLQ